MTMSDRPSFYAQAIGPFNKSEETAMPTDNVIEITNKAAKRTSNREEPKERFRPALSAPFMMPEVVEKKQPPRFRPKPRAPFVMPTEDRTTTVQVYEVPGRDRTVQVHIEPYVPGDRDDQPATVGAVALARRVIETGEPLSLTNAEIMAMARALLDRAS
jgi:hypothetical protein